MVSVVYTKRLVEVDVKNTFAETYNHFLLSYHTTFQGSAYHILNNVLFMGTTILNILTF